MTVTVRKHYSMKMETVLDMFKKARSVADPVATLCLMIPENETVDAQPYFVVASARDALPVVDHKQFMMWTVPVFVGMSDKQLRQYAVDWVEDKFRHYMFGVYIDIEWDAATEKMRLIDHFLRKLRELQVEHDLRICVRPGGGLYLASGNEDTQASYPIDVKEDGTWSVEL